MNFVDRKIQWISFHYCSYCLSGLSPTLKNWDDSFRNLTASNRCFKSNFIEDFRSIDMLWFLYKAIALSIQSCLLYVPGKFQGLKTNKTRVTSNFLRLFKTGNYFCGIFVCCVDARHRRFKRTFWQGKNGDIQDYAPARNVTDVVIFRMSKDCRSELAIFGTPLVAEER